MRVYRFTRFEEQSKNDTGIRLIVTSVISLALITAQPDEHSHFFTVLIVSEICFAKYFNMKEMGGCVRAEPLH